jgi:hypothetical protein
MTSLKINRDTLFCLYLALKNLPSGMLYSKLFLFYMEKNLALLEKEFEMIYSLKESTDPKGEFLEFLQEKNALVLRYALKDENEKVLFYENGDIRFTEEDVILFERDYVELINRHATAIKEHDSYCNEVGQLLEEIISVQVEPIPFKYVPNSLPKEYFEYYKLLIKESDGDIVEKYK